MPAARVKFNARMSWASTSDARVSAVSTRLCSIRAMRRRSDSSFSARISRSIAASARAADSHAAAGNPRRSRSGVPSPSLELPDEEARAIWFEAYVHTYVERDLQALSAITALPDFRRTMRAAALRLVQVLNQSDLARDVAVPQPTVHRWLNLLEASYLIVRLPAFAMNRTTRLIKSPKLFWSDVGLALHLSGHGEPTGAHLENLVLHDLLAWRDARTSRAELHHWRTADGREVDLVIEADDMLLPIEVKSTMRPRAGDTAGLRAFRTAHPDHARSGLLLHAGDRTEWLTADVLAVPWWRVL